VEMFLQHSYKTQNQQKCLILFLMYIRVDWFSVGVPSYF
jgi:hypothetical protein